MNLAAELEPGDPIMGGKYRVEALLGQGAFAQVYRVRHLELKVDRAVKVVSPDTPGVGSSVMDDFRARFRLEAQLGARVDRPHVIRIYDFEEAEGRLYLVMEYAAGGSLAKRLRDMGSLSVAEATRLILEAAAGLEALHKLGVVHRDVKPSNILLDGEGHAKIADLGLAQLPGSPSQRSRLGSLAPSHPGTPEYMSPEQASSSEYLSASSDVYSLGCVWFELLTGRLWREAMVQVEDVRELRPEVPVGLAAVLGRMLLEEPGRKKADVDDPTKRYLTIPAARQALQRAQQEAALGEPAVAQAQEFLPGKSGASMRGSPGWLWAVGSLALLGLAVIAVLVVWLAGKGGTPSVLAGPSPVPNDAPAPTPTRLPTHTPYLTFTPYPAVTDTPQPTYAPRPTFAPVPRAEPRLGPTRLREADGMAMVYVPAGEFLMGSLAGEGYEEEHPQHRVYLDAFWIDRTEVASSHYQRCVQAGVCQVPGCASNVDLNGAEQPVVCVYWDQAAAYCQWAGARLPTAAEWEKAARGMDGRRYPWGNERPICRYAVMNDGNGNSCGRGDHAWPVGSKPEGASPYGVLDMAGNVSEWVTDWYDRGYYAHSPERNPSGPDSDAGQGREVRGGSWGDIAPGDLRSARRGGNLGIVTTYKNGFRCSVSSTPSPL